MNLVLCDLDELHAQLSMVRAFWLEEINLPGKNILYEWYSLGVMLKEIQKNIMDISSTIATGNNVFNPAWIEKIKKQIDSLQVNKSSVILSGNKLCASIHIARAVCRRTEQRMSEVVPSGCPSHLYIKRLSDYLLMISFLKK
jgi:cob(I)alamin adenosyltransferase